MAAPDDITFLPQTEATTQAALRVQICDQHWASRWDGYLEHASGASFYHLYGWCSINSANFGHSNFYLAATTSEHVLGVLPLVLLSSRLFGRILCSLPFVNYGGPCAATPEVTVALIDAAKKLAVEKGADYLEIRAAAELPVDLPKSTHKLSMTLELDPDSERLWSGFSSKHRTGIRRAYKNDLQVSSGGVEQLEEFYQVMAESWRQLGTPIYGKRYFRSILNQFPEQTCIFVCRHAGRPVAAAFNGYFRGTVEGMWAGSAPESRKLQANYVLYWEMIRDACERGCSRYHLGRSSVDSGGENFKKKWNAEPSGLHWYYHLPNGGPLPQLNPANPKYRFAIAAWRRLPLGITTAIGPLLARSIP